MMQNPFDAETPKTRTAWRLILGPPGTGKTTTLLVELESELETGLNPHEIGVVTFTRAARGEAMRRAARKLRVNAEDFEWIRTIHSTAFRLLGLRRDETFSPKDWREFAKRYNYDFSELRQVRDDDDEGEYTVRSVDDELAATLGWGRSRCLNTDQSIARSPYLVDAREYVRFVRRYADYRKEIGRYDFHDMLELACTKEVSPPIEVIFVDEAQDLSPLQIRLVEHWCHHAQRVYIAGDDDQAIYRFMGGDPDWLLGLARECRDVTVLEQSFRVPILVHGAAQKIISQNRHRVPKDYWPRDGAGSLDVIDINELVKTLNGPTFVLARNWYLLQPATRILADAGIPFLVEKKTNWSPFGYPSAVSVAKAAIALHEGKKIHARSFESVIKQIPSRSKTWPLGLPRGTKKRAEENTVSVDRNEVKRWGLHALLDAMDEHGPILILQRMKNDVRLALDRLYKRWGEIPQPETTLMTIHASKGREEETVVVLSDMSRKSYEAYAEGDESEHRVAYVAVTRAKEHLVVVMPTTTRYYPYPSLIRRILRNPPALREPGDDNPDVVGY